MRGLPRILNWKKKLNSQMNPKLKIKKIVDQIWKQITNYNNGSKDEIENKLKFDKRTNNKN